MTNFLDKTVNLKMEVNVFPLRELEALDTLSYRAFLQSDGLFCVDHHEILCSSVAGYPIAVTKQQLDIYINELKAVRHLLSDE